MKKSSSEENDATFKKVTQFVKSCTNELQNIQHTGINVALVSHFTF